MKMTILAIGAHPDDIEFGCGGTLIKYVDRGHRVILLVMTQGGQGGDAAQRFDEQEAARQIVGAHSVYWGGLEDTLVQTNKQTIGRIEEVIAGINPDFIFCNFPNDTHQDHRNLAQATISATRNLRNVLFYEGPTTWGFDPYVFVDISDTLERKIAALQAHASQVNKTNIENLSIVQIAKSSANFRGIQGRVKFAEAFCALRLFINI